MTVVPFRVGITLPGAPQEGDPHGIRDWSDRRALNLTAVFGERAAARRVGGPAPAGIIYVEAVVQTKFGVWYGIFPQDESRTIPNSWFTEPTLDI